MLKAAQDLYGPYRWRRYDLLVLPPSFPYGGMENPGLTFATPTILAGDKSLVSLVARSEEHTSELQSRPHLVCRLLLEKKKAARTCNNEREIGTRAPETDDGLHDSTSVL